MTRSTITELREAVLAAALRFAREGTTSGTWSYNIHKIYDAVEALDQHELDEITDSEGASVLGAPETSRRAAIAIMPRSGTIRRAVLNDIAGRHDGLATDEMIERSLRGKHQTISSARNHLVNAGWLEDSRQRVKDNKAVLWQLTEAAKRQLDLKGNP
jgi:hypothetical protein